MGVFTYIARDIQGQRVSGQLTAATEQSVISELQARELAPVSVQEIRERKLIQRRVSVGHLAAFYRQLADLLRAGVPLLRGLRLLSRGRSNPRLAKVVGDVADDVSEGERLADSLARHDDVFAPVHIAMIRAGERGGFLEPVLGRLATFLEHQAELRAKVLGNMAYPAVLLLVAVGVVLYGLVFFVPQFEDFYSDMDLPLPTQMLLGTSAFMTDYWIVFVAMLGFAAGGIWWAVQHESVRRRLAAWQLRIPKYGALVRSLAVGRFCRILGTMLGNGIPMLTAMQISRDAAGNILLVDAIDEATEAVRAGESLSDPLARSGLFGDDIVEMIAVGESANNLAEVLITIAETIETRVDRLLTMLVRLMEPLLLLCFGAMVLFLFVALAFPMMQMSSSL